MKIIGYIFYGIMAVAIVALVFIIDFQWTKSSLEDLTGKKVSNSTVIWTMLKTNKKN